MELDEAEYELKRGDIVRSKITGETGIFYSYYRYKDNHEDMYILLPMYEAPQIVKIHSYNAIGKHIDIFEKLSQGEPSDENAKMAQKLMKQIQDLFWNNNKEKTSMKNIDEHNEYNSGTEEELNCEQCYTTDHTVVIDYDDFVSLAQKEAEARNSLNYILRALRLGVEPSIITAIFDENTGATIDELLNNTNSPFYIPTDEGEKCSEQI